MQVIVNSFSIHCQLIVKTGSTFKTRIAAKALSSDGNPGHVSMQGIIRTERPIARNNGGQFKMAAALQNEVIH